MKYFKHFSNAQHSESLARLLDEGGLIAYARYWILLEFLSELWTKEEPIFLINRGKLRKVLRVRSWNDLASFVDRLANVRGLMVSHSGNDYRIEAPILLELQSKDFCRTRASREVCAPKNKTKNKTNIPPTPVTVLPNYNAAFQEDGFYRQVHEAWNNHRGILPACITMDNKRKRLIREAREEVPDIARWIKAIKFLADSPFYNGTEGKTFKANINFLLGDGKLVEIIEKSHNQDDQVKPDALALVAQELERKEFGLDG